MKKAVSLFLLLIVFALFALPAAAKTDGVTPADADYRAEIAEDTPETTVAPADPQPVDSQVQKSGKPVADPAEDDPDSAEHAAIDPDSTEADDDNTGTDAAKTNVDAETTLPPSDAATSVAPTLSEATEATPQTEESKDAEQIAEEDDMIDLKLTTALIIVVCSILFIAVAATVICLAKKNKK